MKPIPAGFGRVSLSIIHRVDEEQTYHALLNGLLHLLHLGLAETLDLLQILLGRVMHRLDAPSAPESQHTGFHQAQLTATVHMPAFFSFMMSTAPMPGRIIGQEIRARRVHVC